MKVIRFYGRKDPCFAFSNFSRDSFELDGYYWKTSEHYFQAMKFVGTEHFHDVRLAPTPSKAAEIGRDRTRPLRHDWEQVKDKIMYDAIKAKFTQNPDILEVLLGTGSATLIEASPTDKYWGEGKDRSGKNMLGILLMQLREELSHN